MVKTISENDESPLVLIIALLLLSFTLIAFSLKIIVKLFRKAKATAYDDWLLVSAVAAGIIQVILTSVRTSNGFGKALDLVSPSDADNVMKLGLAANVFYICSLTLSKISTTATAAAITPSQVHLRIAQGVGAFIILWGIISIFVVCFECSVPRTWDMLHGQCINITAWWIVFDSVNAINELTLMTFFIYLIYSVQLTGSKKLAFSLPFMVRVFTVAAFIADAVVWGQAVGGLSPQDRFLAEWKTSITQQVVQACCLIAACSIFIGRFIGLLQTGWGIDAALTTTTPIELRGREGSTRSHEILTNSAAPIEGSMTGSQHENSQQKEAWSFSTNKSGPK